MNGNWIDVGCPRCGCSLNVSLPHGTRVPTISAAAGRCPSCDLATQVTITVTPVSELSHARDRNAPFAGLIDAIVDATWQEARTA